MIVRFFGCLVISTSLVTMAQENISIQVFSFQYQAEQRQGSFLLQADRADREPLQWRIDSHLVATRFVPNSGVFRDGFGRQEVVFQLLEPSENHVTFEIAAVNSGERDRYAYLLTFNADQDRDLPPSISNIKIIGGLRHGGMSLMAFDILGTNESRMHWSMEIVSGDMGGYLNGEIDHAEGIANLEHFRTVWVAYQDDPDQESDTMNLIIKVRSLDETRSAQSVRGYRLRFEP